MIQGGSRWLKGNGDVLHLVTLQRVEAVELDKRGRVYLSQYRSRCGYASDPWYRASGKAREKKCLRCLQRQTEEEQDDASVSLHAGE